MKGHYFYYLDTGWGCGGVVTDHVGTIIDSAPIFKMFRGQDIERLKKIYKVELTK